MKLRHLLLIASASTGIWLTGTNISSAQSVTLKGIGGSDTIFVWKDKESQNRAIQLIQAGVAKTNPGLIIPLLSCMVPVGTRAIITSGGFATQDIQIIDGENAGCEGNVPTENISQ